MEISQGNNDLEQLAVEVLSKNFDGSKTSSTKNSHKLVSKRKQGEPESIEQEENIQESYKLRWSDERVEPSSEFTIGTKVMLRSDGRVGSVTMEKAGGWRAIKLDDGSVATCRSVFYHTFISILYDTN